MAGYQTTLDISELFASLQGEGPSAGTPAFFLRLAHCNLRCCWCDSAHTWDPARAPREPALHTLSIADIARAIGQAGQRTLVITGGEPLLQQEGLVRLLSGLPRTLRVELETNGTIWPCPELAERINQWNVSPKLASSRVPGRLRLRVGALAALRDTGRAWLKIAIASRVETREVLELVSSVRWARERVCLMPRADTLAMLRQRSPAIAQICLIQGFRFSSRLQLELWDGQRGR